MPHDLDELFDGQAGVATTGQLLTLLSSSQLDTRIQRGDLIKVWAGIYSQMEPDTHVRLRGLDLRAGEPVARVDGRRGGSRPTSSPRIGHPGCRPAQRHVWST